MNNNNARDWLLSHGYTQWQDGCWQSGGYEADPESVLQEYMDEQEKNKYVNTTAIKRGIV